MIVDIPVTLPNFTFEVGNLWVEGEITLTIFYKDKLCFLTSDSDGIHETDFLKALKKMMMQLEDEGEIIDVQTMKDLGILVNGGYEI